GVVPAGTEDERAETGNNQFEDHVPYLIAPGTAGFPGRSSAHLDGRNAGFSENLFCGSPARRIGEIPPPSRPSRHPQPAAMYLSSHSPCHTRQWAAGPGAGMRDKRIPRGVRMRHSQGETEELLAAALPLLTEILRFLRVRHGLSVEEAEDFGSLLKIKLLDNDRSVLRAYRGDSSLRTYLAAVANRLFLDQRVSVWGRWRPSAKARRLGPLAVELEELVRRERRPLGDAIEVMAARHAGKVSRGAIDSLAGDLRLSVERTGRTPTGPDAGTAGDSPLARLARKGLRGKGGGPRG